MADGRLQELGRKLQSGEEVHASQYLFEAMRSGLLVEGFSRCNEEQIRNFIAQLSDEQIHGYLEARYGIRFFGREIPFSSLFRNGSIDSDAFEFWLHIQDRFRLRLRNPNQRRILDALPEATRRRMKPSNLRTDEEAENMLSELLLPQQYFSLSPISLISEIRQSIFSSLNNQFLPNEFLKTRDFLHLSEVIKKDYLSELFPLIKTYPPEVFLSTRVRSHKEDNRDEQLRLIRNILSLRRPVLTEETIEEIMSMLRDTDDVSFDDFFRLLQARLTQMESSAAHD